MKRLIPYKIFEGLAEQEEEALSWAISKGYTELVNKFKLSGVSMGKGLMQLGEKYSHAEEGSDKDKVFKEIIKFLDDGANIKYTDSHGRCIMRHFVDYSVMRHDHIDELVKRGANTEKLLIYHLDYAYRYGNRDVNPEKFKENADYLLSIKGCDINAPGILKSVKNFYCESNALIEYQLEYLLRNGLDMTKPISNKNRHNFVEDIMFYGFGSEAKMRKVLRDEEFQIWLADNRPLQMAFALKNGVNAKKPLLAKRDDFCRTLLDMEDIEIIKWLSGYKNGKFLKNNIRAEYKDTIEAILDGDDLGLI